MERVGRLLRASAPADLPRQLVLKPQLGRIPSTLSRHTTVFTSKGQPLASLGPLADCYLHQAVLAQLPSTGTLTLVDQRDHSNPSILHVRQVKDNKDRDSDNNDEEEDIDDSVSAELGKWASEVSKVVNQSSKENEADLIVPESWTPKTLESMTTVALLSRHSFDRYLKKPSSKLETLGFLGLEGKEAEQALYRGQCIAAGTILAREMANERSDVMNPECIHEIAREIAETHNMTFEHVVGQELYDQGYEMIHAVGRGAKWQPRIISMNYRGAADESEPPIVLIGKGITFDTGGLNLKPTNSIENMHLDMGGAAAVCGAMKTIGMLKLPVNVVAVLAVAENAIDADSYKPFSILNSSVGSVEVSNTDAEGRLALGDAFTYVNSKFESKKSIIDVATLTGACIMALGEDICGLFSNNDELAQLLINCGEDTLEPCWRLPITSVHRSGLKGTYSDIQSIGKHKGAKASAAAAFLEKFVPKQTPWAHLDIAGPAMRSSKSGFLPSGGTGYGVRLLVEAVCRSQQQ